MSNPSYLQIISRSFIAFFCTFSLWSTPATVHASCYQPQVPYSISQLNCYKTEESCCAEEEGWMSRCTPGKTALIIGGAVIAGGIAGAIAGNAAGSKGHHGKKGSPGSPGPTGPAGITPILPGSGLFTPDTGNVLIFGYDLIVSVGLLTGSTITPFVERPDGITIEGIPVTVGLIGVPDLGLITITDPVYGTYHPGLRLTNPTVPINELSLALTGNVFASRNASTTNLGISAIDLSSLLNPGVTQAQTTLEFTYDAATIP